MREEREKLTLTGIQQRRDSPKRLIGSGRYLTSGEPRSGGLASVYRALDTQEERYVALKVFRSIPSMDDVIEESFRRETQALSDLRHENIVQILDSGFDDSSGEHFISMEWVDGDLVASCRNGLFKTWQHFFPKVGRQILEALAFAHTHAIAHRDIKPSNILISSDGLPKVCDFGISKIRNFLEPGVTLAQYASLPYAPPEPDDGNFSYTRDVFGFAAVCVATLSEGALPDHYAVQSALEHIDIADEVRALLRRCLSLDRPGDRPDNAAVLLAEFDRLQPRPPPRKRSSVWIALTNKVRDVVEYDLGLKDATTVERFVEADLSQAWCMHEPGAPRPNADGSTAIHRAIRLLGSRYGYIAITPDPPNRLVLVSALEMTTSELDRSKDKACDSEFSFLVSKVSTSLSSENLVTLHDQLLQFTADQKVVNLNQREQAIYKTWLDLLSAKAELERTRRRKMAYRSFEATGNTVRFMLPPGADSSLLDDQDIKVELIDGELFGATVVAIGQDSVIARPSDRNRVDVGALPPAGTLLLDTAKADAALDKQKSAVDAVRYGRAVNPLLGTYVISPQATPVPAPVGVDFIQSAIDEDKRETVRAALANPSLMIVEGPPGTGKTTFITELVLQVLRRDPGARVLLTSQTHVALDNSLERIAKESTGSIRAVRIGNDNDERIAASSKALLIDNKLPVMRKAAMAEGRQFIERWATENSVDLRNARIAMVIERHAQLQDRLAKVRESLGVLRVLLSDEKRKLLEADEREDADLNLATFVSEQDGLLRDLKESLGDLRKLEPDKEAVDLLASCSVAELQSWADTYSSNCPNGIQLRRLLATHADWEVRFGRSREFRAALIASSQIVAGTCLGVMSIPGRNEIAYDLCIVDEASIATPTEVLVPMSRARRTILVGDRRQLSPFQDPELRSSGLLDRFQLKAEDQKATLFNHLNDALPEALRKRLTTQHRMVPAIGNLISECFYKDELKSVERAPAEYLKNVMPRPVVWFSTSRQSSRGSKKIGTSHVNDLEVQFILNLLARIDFSIRHGKEKEKRISAAVLTGYGEQRRRLSSAIDPKRHTWESYADIYVNVVDAFQGREADILIFSVTRSDSGGLGFLREMERINVALSRGKDFLAIVGDHAFCQNTESRTNPLKNVLDYISRHPGDCSLDEVSE